MASGVRRMKLGSQGLEVSGQGLGCMTMTGTYYGPSKPESEMVALLHRAIHSGVTFLDTADVYGPFSNEILIGKALKEQQGLRDKVQLATKFGIHKRKGQRMGEVRGDPEYVRECCLRSLERLQVDYIDLYYVHRIDHRIPIEITMREIRKLVEEGKIKYVGLAEASALTIRRAHAVHPISAVQIEWSLWARDLEEQIVPTCRELGIGIVSYSPLGRGFFSSGANLPQTFLEDDFRRLFRRVSEMAAKKGCSMPHLALSWVHHQGEDVSPIPGTTKAENLNQNIQALSIELAPEELLELESIASADAVKGDRYPAPVMAYTWKQADSPPMSSWKTT